MLKIFEWALRVWASANEIAKKAMPSQKVNDAKFELKKETISETELQKKVNKRNRLLDEMFGDLEPHPELSIEDKVDYEMYGEDAEVRALAVKILSDRLNASKKYNRIKNKTSKFKL